MLFCSVKSYLYTQQSFSHHLCARIWWLCVAGFLIHSTGNFDVPFMVVGGMELLGGVLYFTIKCFMPRYGYRPEPPLEPLEGETEAALAKRLEHLRATSRTRTRSRMMSESFT